MATNEMFISWLNDAYAMETAIVPVLEDHLKDIEENHVMNEKFPEMKVRIREHLELTKSQAERVKGCIERHGSTASTAKSAFANMMGVAKEKATGLAKDEIVKNSLTEYMTEHTEIASYTSLIAAAEELGDQETMTVCEGILEEEREMAQWVEEQIPLVTQEFLRMQQ